MLRDSSGHKASCKVSNHNRESDRDLGECSDNNSMPLITVAAATMDTDRMIFQDGSPGSGSGQSHQDLIVSSLARRKKAGGHPPPPAGVLDRPLPPIVPPAVPGRSSQNSQIHNPQPVFGGISNPAYARQQQHDQTR